MTRNDYERVAMKILAYAILEKRKAIYKATKDAIGGIADTINKHGPEIDKQYRSGRIGNSGYDWYML